MNKIPSPVDDWKIFGRWVSGAIEAIKVNISAHNWEFVNVAGHDMSRRRPCRDEKDEIKHETYVYDGAEGNHRSRNAYHL